MKKLKHILVFMLIFTLGISLSGCTAISFGKKTIKMNTAIKPKNSSLGFQATIKGIEEKSGYYVLAIEVKNKNKETKLNCGQTTLQLQYLLSKGKTMSNKYGAYKLRNIENKNILEDNITTYSSALRATNDTFSEEYNSVTVEAKETKIVYLPIAQVSIDVTVDKLELVYMDNEKNQYVVIN